MELPGVRRSAPESIRRTVDDFSWFDDDYRREERRSDRYRHEKSRTSRRAGQRDFPDDRNCAVRESQPQSAVRSRRDDRLRGDGGSHRDGRSRRNGASRRSSVSRLAAVGVLIAVIIVIMVAGIKAGGSETGAFGGSRSVPFSLLPLDSSLVTSTTSTTSTSSTTTSSTTTTTTVVTTAAWR